MKVTRKKSLFGGDKYKFVFNPNDLKQYKIPVNIKKEVGKDKQLFMEFTGGGIMGVVSAISALLIEENVCDVDGIKKTNKNKCLADICHFGNGTSSGAILLALMSLKYPFRTILKMMVEKGSLVFKKNMFGSGVFGSLYNTEEFEKMLDEYMGDITLEQVYKTTGFDGNYWAFLEYKYKKTKNGEYIKEKYGDTIVLNRRTFPNLKLKDAVRASMAAPIFFNGIDIEYNDELYILFDGGTTGTHNCSIVELAKWAHRHDVQYQDAYFLSIGSGNPDDKCAGMFTNKDEAITDARQESRPNKLSALEMFIRDGMKFGEEYQESRFSEMMQYDGLNGARVNPVLMGDYSLDTVDKIKEMFDDTLDFYRKDKRK